MRVLWSILFIASSFASVENAYGMPRSGGKLKSVSTWWQSWQQSKFGRKAGGTILVAALCTTLSCAPYPSYQDQWMSTSVYEEKMGRIEALEKQQKQERQLLHERLLKQDRQLVRERYQKRLVFDFDTYRERLQREKEVEHHHWQEVLALARQEGMSGFPYFANHPHLPPIGHNFLHVADDTNGNRVSLALDRDWHPVTPLLFKMPDPPLTLDYILSLGVDRQDFTPVLFDYPHLYMGKLITFTENNGDVHLGIVCSFNYDNPSKLVVARTKPEDTYNLQRRELRIITTEQVGGILFNENYVDGDSDPNSGSFLNRGYANYGDNLHTGHLALAQEDLQSDWNARLRKNNYSLEGTEKLGTTFWLNFSDGYRLVEVSHELSTSYFSPTSIAPKLTVNWHKLRSVTDVLIHTDNLTPASPPPVEND